MARGVGYSLLHAEAGTSGYGHLARGGPGINYTTLVRLFFTGLRELPGPVATAVAGGSPGLLTSPAASKCFMTGSLLPHFPRAINLPFCGT